MRPTILLVLAAAAACVPPAGTRSGSGGPGYLISADRIQRSGATNAWDALVRTNAPVGTRQTSSGEPRGLSRRGPSSILLDSTPLLVVDDVLMSNFRYLRNIPAETIAWIRILNGADGTVLYGTGAGSGVVVVKTQAK